MAPRDSSLNRPGEFLEVPRAGDFSSEDYAPDVAFF